MKNESYFKELAESAREMPLSDAERNQALEACRLLAGLLVRPRCATADTSEVLRDTIGSLCAVYGLAVFGKLPQDSDGRFVGLPD